MRIPAHPSPPASPILSFALSIFHVRQVSVVFVFVSSIEFSVEYSVVFVFVSPQINKPQSILRHPSGNLSRGHRSRSPKEKQQNQHLGARCNLSLIASVTGRFACRTFQINRNQSSLRHPSGKVTQKSLVIGQSHGAGNHKKQHFFGGGRCTYPLISAFFDRFACKSSQINRRVVCVTLQKK